MVSPLFLPLFLYSNPHYHGPGDRAETLDYAFMANLVRSLELALKELAGGG